MAKKLYYKIGEACKLLDVKPFVLRYWETEFPFLSPSKSKSGQRIYSESDLELVRRINELLNVEGYTIAGARKKLQAELEAETTKANAESAAEAPAEQEASAKPNPAGAAAAGAALDTRAQEEIKRWRSGVEAALGQTRAILELLGAAGNRRQAETRKAGTR